MVACSPGQKAEREEIQGRMTRPLCRCTSPSQPRAAQPGSPGRRWRIAAAYNPLNMPRYASSPKSRYACAEHLYSHFRSLFTACQRLFTSAAANSDFKQHSSGVPWPAQAAHVLRSLLTCWQHALVGAIELLLTTVCKHCRQLQAAHLL